MELLLSCVALLLAIVALGQTKELRGKIRALEMELGRRRTGDAPFAAQTAAVPAVQAHLSAAVSPASTVDRSSGRYSNPLQYCPGCATVVRRDDIYCPECGALVAGPQPAGSASAPASTGLIGAVAEATGISAHEPLMGAADVEPLLPPLPPRQPVFNPVMDKVRTTEEWEALIGGRWMNRVGAIALILGMAFFFKYAVDNNWISESMRVAIGVVVGVGLLVGAWEAHKRDLAIFAQGLVGAGLAVLYLSIYASANFYDLIPEPVALSVLGAVIAIAFVQAFMYDSLAVALLAWAGGFATVPLLGISKDTEIGAICYVLLLDAGILSIVYRRDDWFVLEPLAMTATYLTFFGWYAVAYDSSALGLALVSLTLFWALFYGLEVTRLLKDLSTHSSLRHVLGGANVLLYFGGVLLLLHDHHTELGLVALTIGAVYIATILLAKRGLTSDDRIDARYTVTALILAVIATPVLVSGFLLPILWSLEALTLLWCGARWSLPYVWWPSIWLYALASAALLASKGALSYVPVSHFVPVWNERALAFIVLAVTLAIGTRVLGAMKQKRAHSLAASFHYAWCAAIFLLITVETIDFFSRQLLGADHFGRLRLEQMRSLVLAVMWMGYSLPLIYYGLRRRIFPVLSSGLAVVALAVGLGAGAGMSYQPIEHFAPVLNHRAILVLLLMAGLAVHHEWLRRGREAYPWIGTAIMGYRAVLVLLGFELISVEIHDYFRHASGAVSESAGPSGIFLELVTLAAIWMLYSFPLVRYGLRNRSLVILLTGLGSVGAAAGAGAVASMAYQPDTWLSTALTLRPIILLFLAAGLLLHIRWIREAQTAFTWLNVVLFSMQACTVLLGFELITAQTRDVYDHQAAVHASSDMDRLRSLEQLTLSVLWLVYAIGLLIVGLWRRLLWLRLASMALMGFIVLKIVSYDLSFLTPAFRSISFVGLGVVLLAASYLYQRYRSLLLEGAS